MIIAHGPHKQELQLQQQKSDSKMTFFFFSNALTFFFKCKVKHFQLSQFCKSKQGKKQQIYQSNLY